jgi:apolipoprotein N-acyltransferase
MKSPDDVRLTALLRHRTTVIWLLLVVATCVSWWLGTSHGFGVHDHAAAGVVILTVAFVKVRFVGLDFMELRDAPLPLRAVFETYVLVVYGVVAGLYLAA